MGDEVEILVEQVRPYAPQGEDSGILQLHGRSRHNISVNLDVPEGMPAEAVQALVGTLVHGRVEVMTGRSLRGVLSN